MRRHELEGRLAGRGQLHASSRSLQVEYDLRIVRELVDGIPGLRTFAGSVIASEADVWYMPGEAFVLELADGRRVGVFNRELLRPNAACRIEVSDAMDLK